MARPRTPTKILKLRGVESRNPGRLKAREGEPQETRPLGDPPDSLTDAERVVWGELAENAVPGVLGKADRHSMELLSRLMAKFRAGDLSGGERGHLIALLRHLGFTPGDRSRINVPKK